MAVPACCRIWPRVRLAVSEAKSASWIRLREADRFSEVACRFDTTALKRFWYAPSAAFDELTEDRAASMVPRAACAPEAVLTSTVLTELVEVVLAAFWPS